MVMVGLLVHRDGRVGAVSEKQAWLWRSPTEAVLDSHEPGTGVSEQTSRRPWEDDVLAADSAFFTALMAWRGMDEPWTGCVPASSSLPVQRRSGRPAASSQGTPIVGD